MHKSPIKINESHICATEIRNAANSSSNSPALLGLINPTIVAQEQEDPKRNTAAPAKSWLHRPDLFAVCFIRQLRNLKVLGVITTGAELGEIVLNQRISYYISEKNKLCIPITKVTCA